MGLPVPATQRTAIMESAQPMMISVSSTLEKVRGCFVVHDWPKEESESRHMCATTQPYNICVVVVVVGGGGGGGGGGKCQPS